jgi:hypothetical protein
MHVRVSVLFVGGIFVASALATEPVDIGSRLELFVDDYLIEELAGDARLQLHKPVPREVVLVTDRPWEGNTSAYYTLFRDGNRYRMYYRGSHFDETTRKAAHREVTCYAESRDGIRWERPALGLFEWEGSRQNNIVWDGAGAHNFTPFRDANPSCPPDQRYKALASTEGERRPVLLAFASPDGLRWRLLRQEPVITEGAFDSQNLAFWDTVRGRYVEFHRGFRDKIRDIMTSTSPDFLNWTKPVWLEYPGAPREHLYTNAILPYHRAPHIFLGFPTRFFPDRGEQVEPVFMSSRDGLRFRRWPEALIPVTAPRDRDGNRSNYMAWGILELPGAPNELSVYATEAYYTGPDSRLRRFTFRVDGFVSVRAEKGGTLRTKPLRFSGDRLLINLKTEAGGSLRVGLEDEQGRSIEGFGLEDCPPIRTDSIAHTVAWRRGSSLARLKGKPVRLRFELSGADLFSLQFK